MGLTSEDLDRLPEGAWDLGDDIIVKKFDGETPTEEELHAFEDEYPNMIGCFPHECEDVEDPFCFLLSDTPHRYLREEDIIGELDSNTACFIPNAPRRLFVNLEIH